MTKSIGFSVDTINDLLQVLNAMSKILIIKDINLNK